MQLEGIGVADSESVLRLDVHGGGPAATVEVVPEACEAVIRQLRWWGDPSSLGYHMFVYLSATPRGLSCSAWTLHDNDHAYDRDTPMLRSDTALSMYLDELVAAILAKPGPLRLVAVDGPGGAGKSTFASELSEAAGGAPVVHTDDSAAADNPTDWWPGSSNKSSSRSLEVR